MKTGFITRYFLRRLAIARRKHKSDPTAAFNEAKVETILVFLGAPAIAILSAIVIGSLRWLTPAQAARYPLPPKFLIVIAIWVPCAVVGNWWLNRRFKKFKEDPSPCFEFASNQDQIWATSQKIAMLTICGIGIPMLAFVFAFWGRL